MELDKVSIDPVWIRQVVINLVLNAVEAMSASSGEGERKLTLSTEQINSGDSVIRLRISDTGGGIPENNLQNIFNPFFTTKPRGTGLGLSLCKKIIRMHHGSLEIDNKLGVGVTFIINLPCPVA